MNILPSILSFKICWIYISKVYIYFFRLITDKSEFIIFLIPFFSENYLCFVVLGYKNPSVYTKLIHFYYNKLILRKKTMGQIISFPSIMIYKIISFPSIIMYKVQDLSVFKLLYYSIDTIPRLIKWYCYFDLITYYCEIMYLAADQST